MVIDRKEVEFLSELSWTQIAALFGVCCRILYTVRSKYGMIDDQHSFTSISNQELYDVSIIPDTGYNMM